MTEEKARQLAQLIGGLYFNSGGGCYIAYFVRPDGLVVAFTDEAVCLYRSVSEIGNDPLAEVELM